MTTSLAALAASSSAHTPSSVLMSTNLSPNQPGQSNSNTSLQSPSASSNPNTSVADANDSTYEIKTEFYTREGLWKLVTHCEYARQNQNLQLNQSLNSNTSGMQSVNSNLNSNLNSPNLNQSYSCSSNDPVRIGLFKYSKSVVFKDLFLSKKQQQSELWNRFVCDTCASKSREKEKFNLKKLNENDNDDDNDVIFTQFSSKDSDENNQECELIDSEDEYVISRRGLVCKVCNVNLINDEYLDEDELDSDDNDDIDSKDKIQSKHSNQDTLDLILFNYARDIYLYEFNSIKSKNESKNLIDKKSYKTVISTCFDINKTATISNTVALQLAKINNSSNLDYNSLNLNISPSNLSLIVAAGFNKGEIHVFDVFKKDASVFYNNTKLVDKTKVTCIKWLPNSMSLFLVGYSSGNIYLYDVYNQTQSSVAPMYIKLCQNESFSLYINSSSSSSSSQTLDSQHNMSSSSLDTSSPQQQQSYKKLILSNTSQPSQVAKNPLLKLAIGPPESNYSYGVNGINEFEFSPCGNYLAVVSQDGYLRVFTFIYQTNQQMQLQLRCSMKSYFGGLLCVCWSPDGKYIATGGEDDLITIFSFVEMRVACRGRGHSSWINSCTFDPWTKLSSFNNTNAFVHLQKKNHQAESSDKEQENESDLEEYHNKQAELEKHLEKLELEKKSNQKNKITAPKKRTISTLSDYNCQHYSNDSSIFYRLASVGQDNQICFWDLTEDVLKEKSTHNSRSRITSMIVNNTQQSQHQFTPQIVIQQSDLSGGEGSIKEQKSHHSTASSIVSTAKSLFSSKHSASGDKLTQNQVDGDEPTSLKSSTLSGSFFKRHKRNSSLNSASSQGLIADGKTRGSVKNSPIVLNSYKKSTNMFSSIPNETSSPQSNDNNYGVNSLNSKKQTSSPMQQSYARSQGSNTNPFNLCPKIDEVPNIEPLICKRISTERLTSINFKKDCFTVATQDGFIYTWARPRKQVNSISPHQVLPQLSTESKVNFTSL